MTDDQAGPPNRVPPGFFISLSFAGLWIDKHMAGWYDWGKEITMGDETKISKATVDDMTALSDWYRLYFTHRTCVEVEHTAGDDSTYEQFEAGERGLVVRITLGRDGLGVAAYEPLEYGFKLSDSDIVLEQTGMTFGEAAVYLEQIDYRKEAREKPRMVSCGPGGVDSKIEYYDADEF